jgi:hypothetical protein
LEEEVEFYPDIPEPQKADLLGNIQDFVIPVHSLASLKVDLEGIEFLMIDVHNQAAEARFDQDGKIFIGLKKEYICSFSGEVEITITAATSIQRDP